MSSSRPLRLAAALALAAACAPPDSAVTTDGERSAQALTAVTGFGSNPGNLAMLAHVPAGMPESAPLVVVLHGCVMTGAGMENSGWTAAANLYKFYVVYAQQPGANNGAQCFNWFNAEDYTRGSGEALSIKQMVDYMKANYSVDASRVFVAGFSAGGYMASVMMAAYPDVFAAGAINAGGPYRCANSSGDSWNCMGGSVDKTPAVWGDLARGAYPGYAGPRPRVHIWHGTSDATVRPANMTEAMEQWTNVLGIDQQADTSDTVNGYPHKAYRDNEGRALVETFEITGMGHAHAIDPQFAFPSSGTACGATGAYLTDANVCAVHHQWQFFTQGSAPPPPPPPPVDDPPGPVTAAFGSVAAEDGYVKAFADGSGAAIGTLANLAVGRGTDAKLNRAILSFDTASIPDGATVERAYLTVAYSSGSGDPWSSPAGNTLVIDVKGGTFGAAGTELSDWAAAADAAAVADVAKLTGGTRASGDFSGAGLAAINKTGRTQLRLRFAQSQTATSYVFLREGASATLTVVYLAP